MSGYTKDWISDIVEKTAEKYNGRIVVLWGDYETSYIIIERLKDEYNINVGFIVDSDSSKIDDEKVLLISNLRCKSKEYFIVIPIAFYQSIKNTLVEYEYTTDDYYYFCDSIITKTDDYYEDSHGNKIIGNYRNAKIVLCGFNALVAIGQGFNAIKGTVLYIHSNVKASFGDKCKLNGTFHIGHDSNIEVGSNFHAVNDTIIHLENNSELIMGDDCKFSIGFDTKTVIYLSSNSKANFGKNLMISGIITLKSYANLVIGDDFSINRNSQINVWEHTEMTVGNDCMFSHDLAFYTNDAHSIFDAETGVNINSTKKISSQRKIIIGNHVWIGARSIVLYNTEIGDGSIIGAGSIVKNKIPNNCIAVGVPTRVIKYNVAWSRESCCEDITACGIDYIHMTER